MTIELSNEERDILLDVLRRELSDMPVEVRRTDAWDYHDALKHRQKVMQAVHDRLSGVAAPVSGGG